MYAYLEELLQLFSYRDLLLVLLSILIGLVIGAEREYHNKTAGLRTVILVSVGSCIFTILSVKIGVENPDRLAANIVTGIGFLGAGTIFKDDNKVSGLTTACSIWVTAALGMCIGSGYVYHGFFGALVVLLVLLLLARISKWIEKRNRAHIYRVTMSFSKDAVMNMEKLFRHHNLDSSKVFQQRKENVLTVHWKLSGDTEQHETLMEGLLNDTGIDVSQS